jgi:hypothetical protein
MIHPKICFAALAVVRDAETNSMSVFNILEGVTAVGIPLLIQNMSFFVLWQREEADERRIEGTFTAAIGDQELSQVRVDLDFGENIRNRTVVNLNGLVIPRPGTLRFRIVLTNNVEATYTVDVAAPPPVAQVRGR